METDKDMYPVDIDELLAEAPEAEHPQGIEIQEYVFTNDKTNPAPRRLFHMFYETVYKNKLGVMHALHKDSHKISTLLVGVDYDAEGNVICWPIARLLTEEEQGQFMTPDGNGNYV